jgi:hypothetical protein
MEMPWHSFIGLEFASLGGMPCLVSSPGKRGDFTITAADNTVE